MGFFRCERASLEGVESKESERRKKLLCFDLFLASAHQICSQVTTMTFATAAFAPCFLTRPPGRTFIGRSRNANHLALLDSTVFQHASNSVKGTALSSVAIAGDSAQVFEPIVNVPALGSFLFIAIVFSFLILRVRQVENAVERRKAALAELRLVKSQELSGGVSDEAAVAKALKEYEDALNSEEDARVIVPGVRVVAPNQPAARNEEDVAAARQFLGIDLSDESSSASASSKKEEERTGLSTGSVAVLAVVALSQIALLYMLSFDPMDTFNTLGGSPPPDLPPSSW